MFNATYFTYDGIFSGVYGVMIADFDDERVVETEAFSPSLNTVKGANSVRFYHNGITYDNAPTYQFSIISQNPIPDVIRREMLSWLVGRKQYKKLIIHQPDIEKYYYNCVFTNTEIIYVNGNCHGLRLTAEFDSPYAHGDPTSVTVGSGENTVIINNKSDIIDEYTYPIVEFCGRDKSYSSSFVSITNMTDDKNRVFSLVNLLHDEVITVDNETKYISSSMGGEKLSNFTSKKWLRLRKGFNELRIKSNGDVTITCPQYVLIGY